MAQPVLPLGQALLQQEAISPRQLTEALALQRTQNARLGRILVGKGDLNGLALARAVAAHYALPFADLECEPPESNLLDISVCATYIAMGALPWKREGDVTIIAATDLPATLLDWAQAAYGNRHRFVIASTRDVNRAIANAFAAVLDENARERLYRQAPAQSAKHAVTPSHLRTASFWALLAIAGTWFYPQPALAVFLCVTSLFYCFTIALKALLLQQGLFRRAAQAPATPDSDLPVYTVLVPLYQEAASLPRLLSSLRALDYPPAKLDIKLIVEADDDMTFAAIKALRPEGIFEILRVPFSLPRTKPKACNYALPFAQGEFLTIYDAEDMPEPSQLRKAVARFRAEPELICLQARLNYYNATQNLLTRLFAIEYSTWFDFMLPGLERLEIPIPLGGTSNHLRLSALRALGEWDPYNVTEDADLGVRLSLSRRKTAMLDSITMEEAPAQLWAWTKQRSRWIKGYMQTWIVHMRAPKALFDAFGGRGFWGFQFFVGGPCFIFLTAPLLWALWASWAVAGEAFRPASLPAWVGAVAMWNLLFGFAVHAFMAVLAVRRWRWPVMLPALLCFPLYWLLHSIAAYRALWQLLTRPHHWDKTTHSGQRPDFGWFEAEKQESVDRSRPAR